VGAAIEGRGLLRILATLGRQPEAESFEAAAAQLRAANAGAFPGVAEAEWLRHAREIYDADDAGRPVLSYDPKLRIAVAASIEAGGGPSVTLWPLFEALKTCPVLVVRGENSDILSAETLEKMRREHPGLEAVTLANRGHAPFLTEPEALDALERFLSRHLAAG
ncbi:MAG: alpha/beta hydrolase, partial [Pseudomonadota bacterium]